MTIKKLTANFGSVAIAGDVVYVISLLSITLMQIGRRANTNWLRHPLNSITSPDCGLPD
jgi:hypothetical protein